MDLPTVSGWWADKSHIDDSVDISEVDLNPASSVRWDVSWAGCARYATGGDVTVDR